MACTGVHGCELDSPQAMDVGINRNESQPQNSPNKFGPQTFFRSLAPDCHAHTTRSSAPYKATLHAILRPCDALTSTVCRLGVLAHLDMPTIWGGREHRVCCSKYSQPITAGLLAQTTSDDRLHMYIDGTHRRQGIDWNTGVRLRTQRCAHLHGVSPKSTWYP